VILSGKKGSGRNRVAIFLRNRGEINQVKKGKIAQ
jgi:cytidylate kinase